VSTSVVKCSWGKCSDSLSNMVSNIIRRYIDHITCCLYGFSVHHIPSCSFGSFYHCIYVAAVCFVCVCLIL